jgi:hypothetical protein
VPLRDVIAAVVPLTDLHAIDAVEMGPAVRLTAVPLNAAQGVLRDPTGPGAAFLQLDPGAVCPSGGVVCGFNPGTTALVHDDDEGAFVTVRTATAGGGVEIGPGLPRAFASGATVVEVSTETFGIRSDGADAFDLVRVSNGGATQPILQHVVDFQVRLVDSHVTVRLRIEAASDALRGPPGRLFRNGGTARHARRLVPDIELEAGVTLRNGAR